MMFPQPGLRETEGTCTLLRVVGEGRFSRHKGAVPSLETLGIDIMEHNTFQAV